jgi:hypothetical protein
MSSNDMQTEKLSIGDRITLRSESTGAEGVAIIWRATDNIGGKNNPIIRISEWLRELYSFQLNDKYFIKKSSVPFLLIDTITVTDVTPQNNSDQTAPCSTEKLAYCAGVALCRCNITAIVCISNLSQSISKLSEVAAALSKSLPDKMDKSGDSDNSE